MSKPELPPPEPWTEYQTMFKVLNPKLRALQAVMSPEDKHSMVVMCVNCHADFPLSDLLGGELEEYQCPTCKMTQWEFWKNKEHREVPDA